MSKYSRGADFERTTIHALEAEGYSTIRSAGSKGKIDIAAFKTGEMLFIQCKINGLCSPAERAEVLRLAEMVGAVPLVAYKVPGKAKVLYRRLTGPGPSEFVEWSPDFVKDAQ